LGHRVSLRLAVTEGGLDVSQHRLDKAAFVLPECSAQNAIPGHHGVTCSTQSIDVDAAFEGKVVRMEGLSINENLLSRRCWQ
jgi:hypothetical protein